MNLRPYQTTAVDAIRTAFRSGSKAPLLVMPTGAGKTVCFSDIARSATGRGTRTGILTHRTELLKQASDKLAKFGVEHGIIAPGHTPTGDLIQVASVQTLARRLDRIKPFDLIIIDEAHHTTAGTWRTILAANPAAAIIGVTATPVRTDGQGLGTQGGGVFDTLINGPSISDLIKQGYLVPPRVFAPPIQFSLSGVHKRGGDFVRSEIEQRIDKPVITGDAVKHYTRICHGAPAIAFCASVLHAQHVAEEFRAAGYRAASIDGNMDPVTRARLIAGLGEGRVDVLTSCEIVSEGTDIPVVTAAILLRPTESMGLYLQQVGRVLRPADNKPAAIILDHVGNCMRHGFPDDDREWSLDGIVKKPRGKDDDEVPAVQARQCPVCFALHRPADVCPRCGHIYQPDLVKPQEVDGELSEITPEQAALMKERRRLQERRARSEADLAELARARGYKNPDKWAKHVIEGRKRAYERARGWHR